MRGSYSIRWRLAANGWEGTEPLRVLIRLALVDMGVFNPKGAC